MTRVKDVIDCWFDSGAMPFAQHHYPFENKENFHELFPADFICEGIDQTRGWFYSLLAISTFVKGVSPYKRVLVNDLILDKEGKKMSKSRVLSLILLSCSMNTVPMLCAGTYCMFRRSGSPPALILTGLRRLSASSL